MWKAICAFPLMRTGLLSAGFLTVICGPALGQVMEVADDGSVRHIGGGWDAPRPMLPAAGAGGVQAHIEAAAAATGLSPALVAAVARTESALDQGAISPKGAIGVMQLMPQTARNLGVDPTDQGQNILGGARYLRAQLDRFDGRLDLALAAYNAGPGRVVQYGGVPPYRETRDYVARNLERLAQTAEAQIQGTDP